MLRRVMTALASLEVVKADLASAEHKPAVVALAAA
jgi:hypothetical protein